MGYFIDMVKKSAQKNSSSDRFFVTNVPLNELNIDPVEELRKFGVKIKTFEQDKKKYTIILAKKYNDEILYGALEGIDADNINIVSNILTITK